MSDILPVTVSDTAIFSERGYSFLRLLGEGSYAKVWLVTYQNSADKNRDYSLACKIVDSKKAPRDFINKFLPREMDILTKINHPHLIHLHSIYQRKTKFFIFMRFAEKGDLLDHILAHGEVRENQARLWTRQLSLGLQYLHQLDVVHRDIKCENVLITANNNVKLADFGFSRFIVDSSGKKYLSSTYCGSLAYAAPELLKGKPYDPKRSDIWSLGVVIYVMLNQCMPFNDGDMKKLYELQMNSKWTFRTRIAQSVTEEVKTLIRNMLEPVAAHRMVIEDVVNNAWFATDERLKEMSPREKEALDIGINNKSGLLPKSQKLNIPSWKKRKKDEQLICVTSLRFERSSNQFTFDTMASVKPLGEQTIKDREATRSKTKRKFSEQDRHADQKQLEASRQSECRQPEVSRLSDAFKQLEAPKQSETRQSEARQAERKQSEARQAERQSEARQAERKQSEAKRTDMKQMDACKSKTEEDRRKMKEITTEEKKKADEEVHKGAAATSVGTGAGLSIFPDSRMSRTDKFMSVNEVSPTTEGIVQTKISPPTAAAHVSEFLKAGPAETRTDMTTDSGETTVIVQPEVDRISETSEEA